MALSDAVCFGDIICLYCDETNGYVFSAQSSASFNHVFVHHNQSKEKPANIQSPQAVAFEICTAQRYKFDKQRRKLEGEKESVTYAEDYQSKLTEAKVAAEAERDDNVAEEKRQNGRRLRYGQTIQLRHLFTNKLIHVSTTSTSLKDKNYLMTFLEAHNDKHAHFKIQPRFKVKGEGDIVQVGDQVILESEKSSGNFLHVSPPWNIDQYTYGSELNLGVHKAGFTIVQYYRPDSESSVQVRGGSVIRLFHKEREAYLAAEGVFKDRVSEEAHLRIRLLDQSKPRTMFPPSSAVSYWQIEDHDTIINGNAILWQGQVRLCHMTTRKYLSVTPGGEIALTDESQSPATVFRLHPVIKEKEKIEYDSYTRIEHVLTGSWLHAMPDTYHREEFLNVDDADISTKSLKWDNAPLLKLGAISECLYYDAFTIQRVSDDAVHNFNFVAGLVPIILNLIKYVTERQQMTQKEVANIRLALREAKSFMMVKGEMNPQRQKLFRNLQVIDLMVRFLKCTQQSLGGAGGQSIQLICGDIYSVMEGYLMGDSRKNELYFAKNIEFFETQFKVEGDIGLRSMQMITELILDNRKIVERVQKRDIDNVIQLVKEKKNYRYLKMLSVLCVCNGVALPDNQNYITQKWLCEDQEGVFLTELGQKIGMAKDRKKIFVSKGHNAEWTPLYVFVDRSTSTTSLEEYLFLETQLDLFEDLCIGRNEFAIEVISKQLAYLTWDEAFCCLREELLPDSLRAKYCKLIIALFVDVGENNSILDQTNLSFVYSTLGDHHKTQSARAEVTEKIFPSLRDWIADFLDRNKDMTASEIGHNMLIEQVLNLLHHLVKFGYYGDAADIKNLLPALLSLLDGRNDKPAPKSKGHFGDRSEALKLYREKERFLKSQETKAVVAAKYRASEVVELFMNMQFNQRLEKFVFLFKQEQGAGGSTGTVSKRKKGGLDAKARRKIMRELTSIMASTAFFQPENITAILLDLSNYKYTKMVTKSLFLLNKFYSAHAELFAKAVQAQVLLTDKSVAALDKVRQTMPTLKQLSKVKIQQKQAGIMCQILHSYKELCHVENDPDERHPINQTILLNYDILTITLDILSQEIDVALLEQNVATQQVFRATLLLLQYLACGNKTVQRHIFQHLDLFLAIRSVESQLGATLIEVFTGNQETCMKVTPAQIGAIVQRAAEQRENAPEFIDLLGAIVKIEELNLPLKRNQSCVMEHVMQNYTQLAHILDVGDEERNAILRKQRGSERLSYLVSLIDLMAMCAEGENRFIESLCQTILPLAEVMEVVCLAEVDPNLKQPYLRFLQWNYLNTAGGIVESGIDNLPEMSIQLFRDLVTDAKWLSEFIKSTDTVVTTQLLKRRPEKGQVADSVEDKAFGMLHYFFEAVLPMIETFYQKGFNLEETPAMQNLTNELAIALVEFNDAIAPLISKETHMKVLVRSLMSIISVANVPENVTANFLAHHGDTELKQVLNQAQLDYYQYYSHEISVNHRLNAFATQYSVAYKGANTVEEQLHIASRREYTEAGDEELPLGQEFQQLVSCFLSHSERDKYALAGKLVEQLVISATSLRSSEQKSEQQVTLDVKCLQVLRALMHNAAMAVPARLTHDPAAGEVACMGRVQNALNGFRAIQDTIGLIQRQSEDVVREYLAFLAAMLRHANHMSQKAFEDYCLNTREETFFFSLRHRMKMSITATKEKRLLSAQFEAKEREMVAQANTLRATLKGHSTVKKGMKTEEAKYKKEEMLRSEDVVIAKLEIGVWASQQKANGHVKHLTSDENVAHVTDESGTFTGLEYKDVGHIELILKVTGNMCDGGNRILQNYLREQPDNLKSANLVAETTSFLSILYTHIDNANINLVTTLFQTLNEFATGNLSNHHVLFDSKIVDYVNYILRADIHLKDSLQVLELNRAIGTLLMSMMEENHPKTTNLVKEMAETLDAEHMLRVAAACHQCATTGRVKKDDNLAVGFLFYFILERMAEVYDDVNIAGLDKPQNNAALMYYKRTSMSVEIMKKGVLQKVRFPVKDKNVLREEVKDYLKWNIDRSSPSVKIRELLQWSTGIIDDISYQRRVQLWRVTTFFIMFWELWNNACIYLSLVINIVMLSSWSAKWSLADHAKANNQDILDDRIHDAYPDVGSWYPYVFFPLAAFHNLFAVLTLISFLLSQRPQLPKLQSIVSFFKKQSFGGLRKRPPTVTKEKKSHFRTHLISSTMLYYLLFVAFSGLGTAFKGYFFAFHLLHVVYNNQLLQRVILAVTQNGRSLLWVTFLGVVIVYIFALASFAFLRNSMESTGEDSTLYCGSLVECTVSVLRYGLIGELFEKMLTHPAERDFRSFVPLVVFHLAFFIIITTIGLNIVFGIILDTFSELRALKWAAEQDMKNACFICGRNSYEFETHAQGFDHHVKNDHNMWAYIFFLIHLEETNENDYTHLEDMVAKQIEAGSSTFFPLNHAMCLRKKEVDFLQRKIDQILEKVSELSQKQHQAEMERQRVEIRQRQEQWERQYRPQTSTEPNVARLQAGTPH